MIQFKYVRETEKAVLCLVRFESMRRFKSVFKEIWVPKSQLGTNGLPKKWIIEQKVADAYGVFEIIISADKSCAFGIESLQ